MKYAVIASGGKQYKVSEGNIVELEKIKADDGAEFTFDNVLLYVEDGIVHVGQPHLTEFTVTGKVLGQIKGRKIRVAKFKAKARYRKVYGHRQSLTRVQIEKVGSKGRKTTAKPAAEETETETKPKTTKKTKE